ncbi:putative S-adenosylmethionine-dependent methyltransferase, YraL family [Streptococcus downei F0415]|nr:putative S-adenosylmethionine-dependent methyltransferase, YraL family [Streptococcus downei F0415]
MQVQKSFKGEEGLGKLYLVPTPIGNLQDMTYRSVEILRTVDFICAEDTRNTGLLLKHFQISTKQISFHEHNAYEKIPDLLELLLAGKNLAQVSDAGFPSISDPGHDLVQAAIAQGISVIALPGASAGITALIASGLAPQPHIFYGFLPRKKGQQEDFLRRKWPTQKLKFSMSPPIAWSIP